MCTTFNKPIIDVTATAEKIKACRINKGFSVRQIQNFFNFSSPQAIYNWESGKDVPTVDNLIVLAAIYGVSLDCLLGTRIVQLECEIIQKKSA